MLTNDIDNSLLNSSRLNQTVLNKDNFRISTSASRNRFQNSKYLYFSQSSSFESQSPETHAHNQNSLLKINQVANSTQIINKQHLSQDEYKPKTKDLFESKLQNTYNLNEKKIQNDAKVNQDIHQQEGEEEEVIEEFNEIDEIEYLNEINKKCTEWLERYVLPNISIQMQEKTIHI